MEEKFVYAWNIIEMNFAGLINNKSINNAWIVYFMMFDYCNTATNLWGSCQIRKIEDCAFAENAVNVFSATMG